MTSPFFLTWIILLINGIQCMYILQRPKEDSDAVRDNIPDMDKSGMGEIVSIKPMECNIMHEGETLDIQFLFERSSAMKRNDDVWTPAVQWMRNLIFYFMFENKLKVRIGILGYGGSKNVRPNYFFSDNFNNVLLNLSEIDEYCPDNDCGKPRWDQHRVHFAAGLKAAQANFRKSNADRKIIIYLGGGRSSVMMEHAPELCGIPPPSKYETDSTYDERSCVEPTVKELRDENVQLFVMEINKEKVWSKTKDWFKTKIASQPEYHLFVSHYMLIYPWDESKLLGILLCDDQDRLPMLTRTGNCRCGCRPQIFTDNILPDSTCKHLAINNPFTSITTPAQMLNRIKRSYKLATKNFDMGIH